MLNNINFLFVTLLGIGKIKNKNNKIILLEIFKMWNKLKSRTVVIREVIVPGANLTVPIPKKVTNK